MANHKSAQKRIRSSKKRAKGNKRILVLLKNCEKALKKEIKDQKKETLEKGLNQLFKLADKASKRGVIKKNTAHRKKSRFSEKISALKT